MELLTSPKLKSLNEEEERILDQMLHDRTFRLGMVRKSHFWFFHYYFRDYIKYRTADFHKDIFALTENPLLQNILITAFRGSGKSTLITLSYVIWAILGSQQKKYVIILGQTHSKSQIHLASIKHVFETNALLRQDLGPFKEESQWGALSLILPQYGAKISTGSVEQSIRGMRHNQYRPDVIICDDLEDMDSVRTQENRDRLFNWVTGDVLPAGDVDTRTVFIGTPLHEDSLLKRLENIFGSGGTRNIVRRYPIVDENGDPLWSGKFATAEDVQAEKDKCLNELSWQREYMLRIVQSETQIVKREHIQYYKELPKTGHRLTLLMIDPARSLRATADYTAMVAAHIFGSGKDRRIYIEPHPVNDRLTTERFIGKVKLITLSLKTPGYHCRVYVEDVGFQGVLTDLLVREGIIAKGYSIRGQTKGGRLEAVAPWIELGKVLFPETGCEQLIQQILGFGVERHDDLVDAFTMACLQLMEESGKPSPGITWLTGGNDMPRLGTDDWMTTNRGWTRIL